MWCSNGEGEVAIYSLHGRLQVIMVADGEVVRWASYGHGRVRGSVHGVTAGVTSVFERRAVNRHCPDREMRSGQHDAYPEEKPSKQGVAMRRDCVCCERGRPPFSITLGTYL